MADEQKQAAGEEPENGADDAAQGEPQADDEELSLDDMEQVRGGVGEIADGGVTTRSANDLLQFKKPEWGTRVNPTFDAQRLDPTKKPVP